MALQATVQRWQQEGLQLRHAASGFLGWWLAELKAMLPASLSGLLLHRGNRLVVGFVDDVAKLRLEGGGTEQELGMVDMDSRPRLPQVEQVELRLPDSDVLVAKLRLPLATQENLREVLGFEMDRYTPFNVDQVYYDYRLGQRDHERKQLQLELYVIPRKRLDRRLEVLKSWGLRANTVSVLDQTGTLRKLSGVLPNTVRIERRLNVRGARGLLGLAALLLVVALLLPLLARATLNERYAARVDEVRAMAEEAQQLKDKLQQVSLQKGFLGRKRTQAPLTVSLIDELSRLIPDNTWLDRLELDGKFVRLQGESVAASNLLGLLESSPHFRNAQFTSPVTRNPRTDRERFVIQLEHAGETPS